MYDSVTPPCPPTGTTIRLRKSVLCRFCWHNALALVVFLLHIVVALLYLHPRPRIEHVTFQPFRPVVRFFLPSLHAGSMNHPRAYHHLHATAQAPPCTVTLLASCTSFVASSTKSFAHNFLAAYRSHILLLNPFAPKQADSLPRKIVSPIMALQPAWVTDGSLLPASFKL